MRCLHVGTRFIATATKSCHTKTILVATHPILAMLLEEHFSAHSSTHQSENMSRWSIERYQKRSDVARKRFFMVCVHRIGFTVIWVISFRPLEPRSVLQFVANSHPTVAKVVASPKNFQIRPIWHEFLHHFVPSMPSQDRGEMRSKFPTNITGSPTNTTWY